MGSKIKIKEMQNPLLMNVITLDTPGPSFLSLKIGWKGLFLSFSENLTKNF